MGGMSVSGDDGDSPMTAIARAALPRFGLDPDTPLVLIHQRENTVFRVGAEATPLGVLRVHRAGYRTAQEIRSELAWMEALAEAGVRTPAVRRGADGDGVQRLRPASGGEPRDVTMLGWIAGPSLEEAADPEAYRLLGRTSARIQAHGRSWRPPPWFSRPVWHEGALLGPRALWGDYAALDVLSPAQLDLVHRAAAAVRGRLVAIGRTPDRFGLTHGDLMPDNVLLAGGEPVIIDFDDCGYGWYLYDLATLLALEVGAPGYDAVRDAWLAGYREVAPLPPEHLAIIEALVMARLLLGLGWMHTRRDTSLAQHFTATTVALACLQAERVLASRGARP